jgi:hypothetical protein
MRALARCWLGLALTLAGCGVHERPTKSEAETESATTDCTECDCCSMPTRSTLLHRSDETKQDAKRIELMTVKFDPFMKDIKAQTGRVVCLYQWAGNHAPSRKHLPDVIALQKKFAIDGLVCMTLSMDMGESRKETLKYLRNVNCNLVNYLPAETESVEAWDAIFGCCGIPSVVIYGRNGKQAASFMMTDAPIDLASIEKALVKQLDAK